MSSWTIRRAGAADAAGLTACIAAAYAAFRQAIPDLPDVTEGIAGDIDSKAVWVAEADGIVVGGAILSVGAHDAMLTNLAVAPDWSGRGLGQALLAQAEAECRRLGRSDLALNTHADMAKTLEFYRKMGWRIAQRTGSTVRMEKQLSHC